MRIRSALGAVLAVLAAAPAAAQNIPRPQGDRTPRAAVFTRLVRPAATRRVALAAVAPGTNPDCAFDSIDVWTYGFQPFRNPPTIRSVNGVLRTTLDVRYTNPDSVSIAGCPVTLRSYDGQLVGPTLRVKPGDLLAPVLANHLPRESQAEINRQFLQEYNNAYINQVPASFNTTNLHTHGLHVSPVGEGDNVLLAIPPDSNQPYHIQLPRNHTRGTYWYHAHTHGSTAIQVGSGMEGALIVDDDPARLPPSLRAASDPDHEKIFVIQTLLYGTHGTVDHITSFFPDGPANPAFCAAGIDSLCTWQSSLRRETINGQIAPVIRMHPGEVQRWRLIDAAFRNSIAFQVEDHALNEIATDGIYTGRVDVWPASPNAQVPLQPGYRSDVLIQAHRRQGSTAAEDTFQIIDGPTPGALSVRGEDEPQSLIGLLIVGGAPVDMKLPTNDEMAALNPFPNVNLALQADQVQEVQFKLGSGLQTPQARNYFQVNYSAFNDDHVRYVKLGDTDMWSLTTTGDPSAVPNGIPPLPHVFHIHVNPFQVQRQGPNGQPETVWKDTQFIPPGDTINVYTQYLDYTGAFVLHCHILDHEDLGMMEVVDVVKELPPPGSTMGHAQMMTGH